MTNNESNNTFISNIIVTILAGITVGTLIHRLSKTSSTKQENINDDDIIKSRRKKKPNNRINTETIIESDNDEVIDATQKDDETTCSTDSSKSYSDTSLNSINVCVGKYDVKLLLTLLHVAGCKNNKNCKIVEECADMRLLYDHIKVCKNRNDCNRQKCYIGKILLSHYSKCQEYNCTFCLPSRLSYRNVYIKPTKRGIVKIKE